MLSTVIVIKIVFSCLLLIGASIFNAVMDLSSEDRFRNDWWDKNRSSTSKWRIDPSRSNNAFSGARKLIKNYRSPWYYLGLHTPSYKERFPYSSTILVFLTDGWHQMQFWFHSSWQMALALWIPIDYKVGDVINYVSTLIILKSLFSFCFQIVYKPLKKKLTN